MAFLKLFRSLVPRARIPMRFRPPDAAVALTRPMSAYGGKADIENCNCAGECPLICLRGKKRTVKKEATARSANRRLPVNFKALIRRLMIGGHARQQ